MSVSGFRRIQQFFRSLRIFCASGSWPRHDPGKVNFLPLFFGVATKHKGFPKTSQHHRVKTMWLSRCLVIFASPGVLALVPSSVNKNLHRPSSFGVLNRRQPSSSCLHASGLVQDLQDLGDFDPTVHDDNDGTKTRQLLEQSIKVLERVVESEDSQLLDDILDDDESDQEEIAPGVTKSVDPQKKRDNKILKFAVRESLKDLLDRNGKSEKENHHEKSIIRGAIDLLKELLNNRVVSPPKLKYATYPRHPEYKTIDLSTTLMKRLDGVPPLAYFFSVNKILRLVRHVVHGAIGMRLREDNVDDANSEDRYRAFYTPERILGIPNPLNFLPAPKHVVKHWEDDKELARQYLCGVNPVMICVVKNVEEQLSKPLIDHFGKGKLQELVDEKRLLYVSYDDIAKLEEEAYKNPHKNYPPSMNASPPPDQPDRELEDRFFHAPIAVFELDKKRQELDIMGIQLDRTPDAKVYTSDNSSPDEWLFVKACLNNADTQMHEWVSHLGKTHLTMEPHIIAIHNTLKQKNHPLYTYLKPLCKDTLLLNWGARQTLAKFGENSFGDYMTSVGVGQFMQLIGFYWSGYDFFKSSGLPTELESRGFDESFEMPGYLFREDGLKLWDAYGQFATDFVDELYKSDADVKADKDLQEWAEETVSLDRGNVPGFPTTFDDKKTLSKVLQTLNWIAGGQHAAINFPQYEFLSYSPNKPLNKRGHVPTQDDISHVTREHMFSNTMPSMPFAGQAVTTSSVLSFQTGHTIDKLSDEFNGVGGKSYEKFHSHLEKIGDEIERRNKWNKVRGKPVYHYLHPSEVPSSIDI